MKLPLDQDGPSGECEQVTLSSSSSTTTVTIDDGVGNGHQNESTSATGENGVPPAIPSTSQQQQDVDFSEYMWMEHQEEFDEQVIKELEDEEMVNYYFDLYEATLEEEAITGRPSNGNSIRVPEPPTFEHHNLAEAANVAAIDELNNGFNRLNFASRLNPNAPEFIPQAAVKTSPP